MNTPQESGIRNPGAGKTASRLSVLAALLLGAVGCQQKMADQPAPRTYDENPLFANNQSARPIEAGTVYRGQRPDSDPMVTGLSEKGRNVKLGDWSGAKAYDEKSAVPPMGAPNDIANYVTEFPFVMTETDLARGQQRYNIFCAVCHGAAGDGMGKIPERGYLRPPSYHTDGEGVKKDWSTPGQPSSQLPQGYSRGFFRFYDQAADTKLARRKELEDLIKTADAAKKAEYEKEYNGLEAVDALNKLIDVQKQRHLVPLEKVPAGYIFQVITQGYGGMPDHASQIPPEDRWRITAYVRVLQLSQGAKGDALTPDMKKALDGGKKPAVDPHH